MKVFLSWSGDRSKAVAETLQDWLPLVIQVVEPWLSSEMTKGVSWVTELRDRLEESNLGIFCLTTDNLTAPWLLFEAGAISKTKNALACTLLLDLKDADVEPPLALFQHTTTSKADVLRLVKTINSAVAAAGEKALSEKRLEETFTTYWPRLEAKLQEAASQSPETRPAHRGERELLEELLETVRGLDRTRAAYTVSGWTTLREDETYVMHNGALRPVSEAWIMKDGRWQQISLRPPKNLGLGSAFGENFGGPGLLDKILEENTDSEAGRGDDQEPPGR